MNKQKSYDIYFHNDYDGVSAAVVFADFFSKTGDKIGRYFPVFHSAKTKNRWLEMRLKKPSIIVDFLYNPTAYFWFDHHITSFIKSSWQKNFHPSKFRVWEPEAPSATRVVFESLKKNFGYRPSAHIKNIVYWADIVDTASYRSPRQVVLFKEPAIQLAAIIEREGGSSDALVRIIKAMSRLPIKSVVSLKSFRRQIAKIKKENDAELKFARKNMKVYEGKIAVLDISRTKLPLLRHTPYYLDKDLSYALVLDRSKSDTAYHLHLNYNRWKKAPPKINIGDYLKKFGGGGHERAGGASVKNREKAASEISEITDYVLKNG